MNRTLTICGLKPGAKYIIWACRDKYDNVDEWCSRPRPPFMATKGMIFFLKYCIPWKVSTSQKYAAMVLLYLAPNTYLPMEIITRGQPLMIL